MAPTDALIAASPLATRYITDIPMVLERDPDIRASLYAQAKEVERLDAHVERLRRNLFPQTADEIGLLWWESMLGLTIEPPGLTVDERRQIVLAFYRVSGLEGTGLAWEASVTRFVGAGWTYREHEPAVGSPAAYTIQITVPFPPGSAGYARLRSLLALITPANLEIFVSSADGFILDESGLDVEVLG